MRRHTRVRVGIAVLACLAIVTVLAAMAARQAQNGSRGSVAQVMAAATTETSAGAATDATTKLVACHANTAPVMDGEMDEVWACTKPLPIALTWGIRGTEHALDVELRALYTEERVYFLAQWPGNVPSGEQDIVRSILTLHFDVPPPLSASEGLVCLVSCHTAYGNGSGQLAYVSAETIPPGRTDSLLASGSWKNGIWRVEWSRRLVEPNPFDVQFTDLGQEYHFFVKAFEGVEGRPDPVSQPFALVFER
jgi:hypothetical protein